MRFLIDASLPRSTADLVQSLGHEAIDVRDIGMGDAEDSRIAKHAQIHGFALLTRDFDFADVRNYPPRDYLGIAVVDLPSEINVQSVLAVMEQFLRRTDLVAKLPSNLVIIEANRSRVRSG